MGIRKAVFPAAGLGTRFLPATKAQPKEMLPVVDKPIIQYGVEEAVNSGLEEIVIVTGRNKRAIEDHFDISFELEYFLQKKGELELLKQVREISELATVYYIRQKEPLGLGHAILVTKEIVKDEPFAVVLSDDLIVSDVPCLKQMISIYERYKCSVIAVERVSEEEVKNYGIIAGKELENGLYQITDLIEKPSLEEAPSNLAIVGRYILTPEIFNMLEKVKPGRGGEIQLTDGLKLLLEREAIYAYEFKGKRYDTGNKLGFLIASVELALKREDIGKIFKEYLKNLNLEEFS
ncbi:MAG: UTP--glucose-1-phosphate uridylyltransferase GalU [Dictyoglomaceae bacterium]